MKKDIKTYLMAGLASILSLASCGDLAEADRIILGETDQYGISVNTTFMVQYGDETFEIDDLHRMLIADFTGWKCVNCPDMAEFLTGKILHDYPAILVSLHMTTNSFSAGHFDGYNCASADSILNWMVDDNMASKVGLPSVSIDNVKGSQGVLISDQVELENVVQSRFKDKNVAKNTPRIIIGLNSEMSEEGIYNISTLLIGQGTESVRLQLWLIEEGLKSTVQSSMNGYIQGYENHGILRQVINGGHEGQILNLGEEGAACPHHRLNINGKGYNPENCRVVAIVTDVNTREVLNCLETNL